jgi:outer membrane protein assembly factor BamD (BamD/ComL family)
VKVVKIQLLAVMALVAASVATASVQHPGVGPGSSVRYATDAYPGFDNDDENVNPSRKEPKWFGWVTGPKMNEPAAQFEYAKGLSAKGDFSAAVREFDALVRSWPTSPEAHLAQLECAEICFDELGDAEEAFDHYRYLVDFYSLQCDYKKVTDRMYEAAKRILADGKEVMFIRFENTVDARRAFEAAVLRAPGADWAREAMLTIAGLREKEGRYEQAIKVYENLRSLYGGSEEAKISLAREAEARMVLLDDHGYNRSRCRDTAGFLAMALRGCDQADAGKIRGYLTLVNRQLDDEAYAAAKFYDSKTRTVRSAVNAYERYLSEYPDGIHAEAAKARLEALKGVEK